jgi:abortive infection bacteriophage resistance protein
MIKYALSINEQLTLMKSRGLTVVNENKAKEVLEDIGYYRLGFYLFPFEQTYPKLHHRTHTYTDGAKFGDAVKLYYFDFELRNLLLKYISRIEIHFRTVITYMGSMEYKSDPVWFVNPSYIKSDYISAFDKVVYNNTFKKNPTIRRHHRRYPNDIYAPAWKTIELMTFGENIVLYKSLIDTALQRNIANNFGVKYIEVFENYIELVRILRNTCAHGNVLFDFKPYNRIKRGPANLASSAEYMNLYGSVKVVRFLLSKVSCNRERDMMAELQAIIDKYYIYADIANVIMRCSGLPHKVSPSEDSHINHTQSIN